MFIYILSCWTLIAIIYSDLGLLRLLDIAQKIFLKTKNASSFTAPTLQLLVTEF